MDTTPETHQERVTAVTQLINEQHDVEPAQADSESGGEAAQDEAGIGEQLPDEQLLEQDDDADSLEADSEGAQEEVPGAPDVAAVAEHLGIEPKDLYEMQIGLGDGESVSLGEMKDTFKQYGTVRNAEKQLAERESEFERKHLNTRTELNAILNVIPPEMREAAIQEARARNELWSNDQRRQVLEAIPAWKDPDQRDQDREHIYSATAEYGFSRAEVEHTQDARTLRILKDFADMKRELRDARLAAKTKRRPGKPNAPVKQNAGKVSQTKLQQAIRKAKQDPTMQGKAAVVSQLIRNQR